MSIDGRPATLRPLVLAASKWAGAQAARLLPAGVILENEVERAIIAGAVACTPRVGGTTTVCLDDYQVAVLVRRTTSPLTGRKAWRPIGIAPRTRIR